MRAVALAPAKQTPNTNTPMPRDTGCCARRQHHRHRACSLHAWRRTSTGDSCWQPTPSSQKLGARSSHRHRSHAQQGVNAAVIGDAVMRAPSQAAASAAPHRRSSGHPHTLLHVGDYPRASSLDPLVSVVRTVYCTCASTTTTWRDDLARQTIWQVLHRGVQLLRGTSPRHVGLLAQFYGPAPREPAEIGDASSEGSPRAWAIYTR